MKRARRSATGNAGWPEGPWTLLGLVALAAPGAVLLQGGDAHTAALAALVTLASPCAAIEAMLALARVTGAIRGPIE